MPSFIAAIPAPDSATTLTVWVLASCYGGALLLWGITALVRAGRGPAPVRVEPSWQGDLMPVGQPPPLPAATNPEWPYQPPEAAPTAVPEAVAEVGVPVRFYRPLDFVWAGFIVAVFVVLSIGNAMVSGADAPETKITVNALVVSMGLQVFLLVMTVLMVVWRVGPVEWLGLRLRGFLQALVIGPVAVVVMLTVGVVLGLLGYMEWMKQLGVETTQEAVKALQDAKDPLLLGLMAAAAVVVAPVCEEVVFRGYLYPVAKRYAGRWVAGIASALIFAAAHGALMPLVPLFILAVLLVVAYEATGSLWAPVAMHFCFNATTVGIQFLMRYMDIKIPGME